MHQGLHVCVCVCQRDRVCTTELVCQTTNYCTNVLSADLGKVLTQNILDTYKKKRKNTTTRST